jgi:hypothetical protein
MQVMLLEQQSKKQAMVARMTQLEQSICGMLSQASRGNNNHLQEHQLRMVLLELQNKQRLMMARQEQGKREAKEKDRDGKEIRRRAKAGEGKRC